MYILNNYYISVDTTNGALYMVSAAESVYTTGSSSAYMEISGGDGIRSTYL